MNRRKFLYAGGAAGLSIATLGAKCGGKSVSGTIVIIDGGIAELKLLYPNLPVLDKIAKLAKDFDADWVAGKFDSARTFFENLDTTVQQVISDLGGTATPRVKLLLSTIAIAVRMVATLISDQGQSQPGAMKTAEVAAPATANRVKQLSNAADADWILRATQK